MRQLKSVSNTRNICGSTVNRGRSADIPDHVSARAPHGHVRLQQAGQPQVYSAKRPVPQGSPRQEEARPMNILLEVFWLIKCISLTNMIVAVHFSGHWYPDYMVVWRWT